MTTTTLDKNILADIAAGKEPEWLKEIRRSALDKSGFPEKPDLQHESWRKIDLAGLDLNAYPQNPESVLAVLNCPQGAICEDLDKAAANKDYEETIKSLSDFRLNQENANTFSLLALARSNKGLFIKAGGAPDEALIFAHRRGSGNAVRHRNVIEIKPGSEVTIVEEFHGSPDDNFTFWNTMTDIRVGANAKVNYIALRYYTDNEYFFNNFNMDLERDARAHISVVNVGGFCGKSFYTGRLLGKGAEYRGIGMQAGAAREFHDMEMLVEHLADHTHSRLLYKTVLNGKAHSVFNGNLNIVEGVKGADSYQVNNNILLNKKARAESMPNLIIKAEDVSCEHGATVGELDDEALFYLMSRSIPEGEARNILIQGFINEVIQEIPLADKHEEITLAVENKIKL